MEISGFLLKEQTQALRKSFFENFKQKQLQLLEWLHKLEDEGIPPEDAVSLTDKIFNEIHRYKGTGGTYGFNEISVACKEMLKYIRPPFNEKRRPFSHELKETLILQEKLIRYTPVLEKGLHDLCRKDSSLPCLLLIDAVRGPFADELDFFTLEEHYLVISSFHPKDVLLLLNQLQPRSILIHAPYPDYPTPLLIQKLGETFSCSLSLLGEAKVYEEVKHYGRLSPGAPLPYTSDRGSVQSLVRKLLS